jgi:hypothetical protein
LSDGKFTEGGVTVLRDAVDLVNEGTFGAFELAVLPVVESAGSPGISKCSYLGVTLHTRYYRFARGQNKTKTTGAPPASQSSTTMAPRSRFDYAEDLSDEGNQACLRPVARVDANECKGSNQGADISIGDIGIGGVDAGIGGVDAGIGGVDGGDSDGDSDAISIRIKDLAGWVPHT